MLKAGRFRCRYRGDACPYGKESVYHAHIGTGELHIRPLINLKDASEAGLLRTIGEKTALIVKKYRGSMSGEHGDGRLRGEFIPLIIGEHNYLLNKRIKKVFDPRTGFLTRARSPTPLPWTASCAIYRGSRRRN
jgi:FAD/FMN-containing dehydrogenase